MEILRRIREGHYSKVFEVKFHGDIAIAKFEKPATLFMANLDTFLGNFLFDDNRRYSTPGIRRRYEIQRLTDLRGAGANVPKIIFSGRDYFVMEKIPGKTLAEIEKPNRDLAESVLADLKNMHKKFQVYHGAPHPRNIIINDNGIYWIDWETRLNNRGLEENQTRDIKILQRDLRAYS